MTKIEDIIKKKAELYEAPYDGAAWDALSKKMGPEKGLIYKWFLGIAAGLFVSAGFVWLITNNQNETKISNNNINTSQQINTKTTNQPLITNTDLVNNKTAEEVLPKEVLIKEARKDKNIKSIQEEKTTLNSNDRMSLMSSNNTDLSKEEIKTETEPDFHENQTLPEVSVKFDVKIKTDKNQVCLGNSILFTPSIPKIENAIYQWHMGNGDVIESNFVDYKYEVSGDYVVSLKVLNSKTNQVISSSQSESITINSLPENDIEIELQEELITTAVFKQLNQDYNWISWEIEGVHKTSLETFEYEFKKKGIYNIVCSISNDNGCVSKSSSTFEIYDEYNLLAPNAFSPNGDNLNETFIPKALTISETPFVMTIYNKGGEMVFQTNDASQPWDGLYTKELKPAPNGTYIWLVQLTNKDGITEVYQGHVIVTR